MNKENALLLLVASFGNLVKYALGTMPSHTHVHLFSSYTHFSSIQYNSFLLAWSSMLFFFNDMKIKSYKDTP
jgi:hypothetical protein